MSEEEDGRKDGASMSRSKDKDRERLTEMRGKGDGAGGEGVERLLICTDIHRSSLQLQCEES